MQKFDVLIVGAGMVGLTLALALRQNSQLSVAIVDNQPVTELTNEPEVRVSAINIASKTIFDNLEVWSIIEKMRLQPYQHMHIWDKSGVGKLDFSVADVTGTTQAAQQNAFGGIEQLGWIIENKVIRNALWQKAQVDEGIIFFTEQALNNIAMGESEVFASFVSGQPITAKLVVGADGANSWVRKQMDMAMTFRDYDHHALVATVKCSQGHQNTAWQVFLPSGPLAFLPLYSTDAVSSTESEQANLCSIVYSAPPEEVQRLVALSKEDFSKELTAASDGKLGAITVMSERYTHPLTMRLVQNFVKERVVLIGDASHTIHPLAGQGVNLGLLDATALAQTLTDKLAGQHESGHEWLNQTSLNAFARWRKAEASDMIVAMEGIKQAFTPQQSGVKLLRGLGMELVNHFKPVKSLLIKQALGLKSDLPDLAKVKHSEI